MTSGDPRKAYRITAINSESAADVFIQLYDQLAGLLHSAATAIDAGDIEKKTTVLSRAFTVLIHLQGALDFERGGEVALNLNQFYKLIRSEVSEGSVKLDANKLRQAAAHLGELRNVWEQAQDVTLRKAAAAPSVSPAPGQATVSESRGWEA